MEAAMVQLACNESLVTVFAIEFAESSIELHEDLLPRQVLLLAKEHDKLVDVP